MIPAYVAMASLLCVVVASVTLYPPVYAALDIPIRVVNIVIGNNPLYGYEPTTSAYDVAFEEARKTYPDELMDNINRVTYYMPPEDSDSDYSCTDAGAQMVIQMIRLMGNISYRDREDFVVVLAPGCTAEILNLGDFTREMNVPVLASTVIDSAFSNKERFPTVIATGPSGQNLMVQAVLALLSRYNWTSISIICDSRSADSAENVGSLEVCKAAQEALHLRPWLYSISSLTVNTDSSNKTDFEVEITTAQRHSRIIMIACVPDVQKMMLAQMFDLNMTDGNYVFITFRLPQLSFYYDKVWTGDDLLTTRAVEALRYCLVLTTVAPDWEAIKKETRKMWQKSWFTYGHIVSKEYQHNELQISAYETALMTLEVLNETYGTGHLESFRGAQFSRLFYNRTFNLPSRPVVFSGKGARIENVIIKQYDNETASFQSVLFFDAELHVLTNSSSTQRAITWGGSVSFPPASQPFCQPGDSDCSGIAISSNGASLYFIFLAVFILLAFGCLPYLYWTKVARSQKQWWHIRCDDLKRALEGEILPVIDY